MDSHGRPVSNTPKILARPRSSVTTETAFGYDRVKEVPARTMG